jgi:DNA mismatch repair protein MutS
MHIDDLHFKKEVLPLFDFVQNEFSRDSLIELLSDFPGSMEEVLTRQRIIQCLMGNEALQAAFSYHRSDFNEVYGYLKSMKTRDMSLSGTSLKIHFLFARSERNKESGRLSQLVLFFYKIHQFYFSHLEESSFPKVFSDQIRRCRDFFSEIGLAKYQAIARARRFRIGEIAVLVEFLRTKIREGEMDIFWKELFLFEAYLSIARGIIKHCFIFPVFNSGNHGGLSITRFYHPLVKNPVKNDLVVSEQVTLITGPNMSGKSTLLKAIGICVVLAHLGLAVPADRFELPFFETISISINLNDDLQSGYSHFMAEIKALKNVVVEADSGKACFAIFDELFRGTNTEDALAISATTVNGLTNFSSSHFFISTHLHQLKDAIQTTKESIRQEGDAILRQKQSDQGEPRIGTHYIECRLDGQRPVFTYTLKRGWSDLKIGQILFDREGLNDLLAVNGQPK